jgi:hypothetical protein
LTLPAPGPNWQLTSGTLSGNGHANFAAIFPSTGFEFFAGTVVEEHLLFGANGVQLGRSFSPAMLIQCDEPRITCNDQNPMVPYEYVVASGDGALSGPLTIRYNFDPDWVSIEPTSISATVDFYGEAHLVYSPIPEPGTGLLVMAGLLALAYRQRRHGRAA